VSDKIKTGSFGVLRDGRKATLFTLQNDNGVTVILTDYGATAVSIIVPGKDGDCRDIILGFDDVSGYEKTGLYLGATIGRYAGQINDGKFSLGDKTYSLFINDHGNSLHGGEVGFNKRLFTGQVLESENAVLLTYLSPDGEEGYPGNLNVRVTYSLTPDNELVIRHVAESDADTVLNMTHHSYFNLDGHTSDSILDHSLRINSQKYTEVAKDCSPNGVISDVAGTPLDFRSFYTIGDRIGADFEQLRICEGYDHNWVIDGWDEGLVSICELTSKSSGIGMQVLSDLPGLQVYSGNYLSGSEVGKEGVRYGHRSALCLEPQYYPNSLNHAAFPSPVLLKGALYDHTIIYKVFPDADDIGR